MGGWSVAWTDGDTIWADIQPLSDGRRMQAGRMMSDVTHELTIRYRDFDVTTTRIKFGSRIFTPTGARNPDESRSHLIIGCKEDAL